MNYAVKLLQAASTDWADREAIVHRGERISFGTLARRTAHLAAQLGAEQGAVAVLSRNQPQALISHLACHMAGRPVAHIPRDAARAGQETFLRETGAARLFFDVREAAAAEALAASVPGVRAEAIDHSTPDAFRFPDDGGPPVPQAPASTVRLLLGTGGTTGVPKGAVHTHALIDSLTAAGEDPPPEEEPRRSLVFGDMSHLSWYICLPTLTSGGTLVLHEGFDADALLRLVPAEAITHMMFTPPQMSQLLDAPGCADADLSTLRSVTYGAAPSDRKRVEQALGRFGPVIRQAYGATESGLITLLSPEDHLSDDPDIRYSVGCPAGGARIAVRDPSGVAVPTGESGEVWVTGPAMMEGYLIPARCGDPVERGWLRTGDLGRISADGYLTLDGRVKELITHHATGTHVYPRIIEEALLTCPRVRAAAVCAVPDPQVDGDRIHAAVTAADGPLDEQHLRAHVRSKLGQDHLVPDRVHVLDCLPLTPVGKVDKQALARQFGPAT
ncbi:class I adenylate-forming enzyme family protein [Streptomyces tendae]|uniref:class I adenylate-forming enzyme family protein n=1 Tax=Streptomyces tendae TaxID=1932 RepID=UPI00371BB7C6